MVNGLSVLGWGVGGIEAEAAMLGQPISMLIPEVVGVELKGKLKEGTTATDLVLIIVELSLIHISEPTRRTPISYAVFCLKKKTLQPTQDTGQRSRSKRTRRPNQ